MDTEVVLDTIPDKECAAFLERPEEIADKVQQRVSSDSIPTGPEVTSKMCLEGNIPLIGSLILFADDTTLSHSHKNINYLEFVLKHDMGLLLDWFRANKLTLNLNKTVMMQYWPGKGR